MKTEEAVINILNMAENSEGVHSKTKMMKGLAKDLNKLCQYSLVSPVESANQLFSLAATCSTTEILQQELKNLLAPESCNDWRCKACLKCQVCAPVEKMSAQDQLIKDKLRQNFTIADHVSIVIDKDVNRKVVVSMPIDEELAKVLLKGNNRKHVLAELALKLAKLSPEMKQQIQEEFTKLVKLGYFVKVENLPPDIQQDLLDSPVLFYISLAPSFKMESLSPKARCNLNASRNNKLGHSLNSLLPNGLTTPIMGRSV